MLNFSRNAYHYEQVGAAEKENGVAAAPETIAEEPEAEAAAEETAAPADAA